MIYYSEQIITEIARNVAGLMTAAIRTAPKTRGRDNIVSVVVDGEDLLKLADKLEEIDICKNGENRSFFSRDAENLRNAQAAVLIGVKRHYYGLNCGYCGSSTCEECRKARGLCAFECVDLGIAVSSAASTASNMKIDNRIMFSVGRAAKELNYVDGDIIWLGIPLSISGKNIFFDRKPYEKK